MQKQSNVQNNSKKCIHLVMDWALPEWIGNRMEPAPSFIEAYDTLFFSRDSSLAVNHESDYLITRIVKGILALIASVFLAVGLCCDRVIFLSAGLCFAARDNLYRIIGAPIRLALSVICVGPALLYAAIVIPYFTLELLGKEI